MNLFKYISIIIILFLLSPKIVKGTTILYQSNDESIRIEFNGYIKNFFAVQTGGERFLPEKLPKSFVSLDQVIRALIPTAPHEDPQVSWEKFRDEMGTLGQDQLWIRFDLKMKYKDASVKIAYEIRPWTGSNPYRLIGTIPSIGSLFTSGLNDSNSSFSIGTHFDDRLLDFPLVAFERHSFRLTHQLDRLYLFYSFDFADITIGRQPISIGVGRIFRPADILAPFSPHEFDTEQKRGVDALKIDIPIGDLSEIVFIASLQRLYPSCKRDVSKTIKFQIAPSGCTQNSTKSDYFDNPSPSFLAKAKWTISKLDFFILAGYHYQDIIGAMGFSFSINRFGVHGSASYRYPTIEADSDHKYGLFNGMLNLEYNLPKWKLLVDFSYFHQNFGSDTPTRYLKLAQNHRYLRGETFLLGTDYLGLSISWEIHPLLTFRAIAMLNLLDTSALIAPTLELSVMANLYVTLSSYIGIGEPPNVKVDGDKFNIELKSEFGNIGTLFLIGLRAYY